MIKSEYRSGGCYGKQAVRCSVLIHFIRIDVMESYIDPQGLSSKHPPLANFISSLYQLQAPDLCLAVDNQTNTNLAVYTPG